MTGTAAAVIMLTTTSALANWTSSLDWVRVGFPSRTWGDQSYSQIHFTKCTTDRQSPHDSVHVQLVRVDTSPDTYYDTKKFTECFTHGDGDETSTGVWTGLPAGDYRFYIKSINNADVNVLSVNKVTVDTTKADG
ncbi:hypothetical protein [Streptomyces inusitatus]|uniref:hypothetical protein n=1 Tax=Streptomyces inusitatus TaxID=68221 RepID=UPI00167E7882|nr:hypothetical protein [Streptomyces inusitatus]